MGQAYALEDKEQLLNTMGEAHGAGQEDFIIRNDSAAEWAIKKIAAAREQEARIVAVCEEYITIYQEEMEKAKKRCEQETSHLVGLLDQYFGTVKPDKETATKMEYRLPSGVLRLKKGRPEYAADQDKLVKWAEENAPQYVKTVKSAMWAEIKKDTEIINGKLVYQPTGEIIEAVEVSIRPDRFEVETR